eukprot:TRINITY_DN9796_c0_g1_i2.p2 TRINITY_DN9796_c0_g1~~TRINITY_DN9796_c0_g1_i2.p2  ORF type:complete len:111 (-),score=2.08 TRINITY_DN9796_c0_g1_i2:246-578(-)
MMVFTWNCFRKVKAGGQLLDRKQIDANQNVSEIARYGIIRSRLGRDTNSFERHLRPATRCRAEVHDRRTTPQNVISIVDGSQFESGPARVPLSLCFLHKGIFGLPPEPLG